MRSEPRIMDARDFRLALEPLRELERIGAMPLHAQRERLETAQREKAVERADDATDGVLQISETLRERRAARFAADHDDAADDVRMTVEIFGRGVHDDIETEFQGTLYPGARKSTVGDRDQLLLARGVGHRDEVEQLESGIARRLDPDHSRLGPDRLA